MYEKDGPEQSGKAQEWRVFQPFLGLIPSRARTMHPLAVFSIHLVYGAIFLALGVALASRHAIFVRLRIAGLFWLLALFAFLHAGHEWLELARRLDLQLYPDTLARLRIVNLLLFFSSFISLFLFAITLHVDMHPESRPYLILLLLFFVTVSLTICLLCRHDDRNYLLYAIEYDLRNLIALPACLLSGVGFILYGRRLREISLRGAGSFTGVGLAFVVYGFWTGLVPSGAMVLLPVEIWRGLTAAAVLLFLMQALNTFLRVREKAIAGQLHAAARSERLGAVERLAYEINNPLANVSLQLELLHQDCTTLSLSPKTGARLQAIEQNIAKTTLAARELLRFSANPEERLCFATVNLRQIVISAWAQTSDNTLHHGPVKVLDRAVRSNCGSFSAGVLPASEVPATSCTSMCPVADKPAAIRADSPVTKATTLTQPCTLHYQLDNRIKQALPVDGIPAKIEAMLHALFLNAMEAMPNGGVIEVNGERDGERTILRIADHGVGIDPDKLDRVLEPFFSTKPTGTGLGLGLASCQGIMILHGGTIKLTPRADGRGTVVTLVFPW